MVALKKYRAYIDEKGLDNDKEEGEVERKKRNEIEGSVNLHRVRNIKKQYK